MKRDIFAEDNLMVLMGDGLYIYLEMERRSMKITETRQKVLNEKGIYLPSIHISNSWDIPEYNVQLILFGEVKVEKSFEWHSSGDDDDADEDCFDNMTSFVCDWIYDNAEAFKDFDYETEIENLEREHSRAGYKKILSYYTYINPDKKLQFHYTKKIASFGYPRDLMNYEDLLRKGVGCKVDMMQARKASYRRSKRFWRNDQKF